MAWPLLALGAISLLSSAFSGSQKKDAKEDEAEYQRQQGLILYEEAQRDAAIIREEGEIFTQEQAMKYIGAGFVLQGSALIVLKDMRDKVDERAGSVEERGRKQYELASQKSEQLKDSGRSDMIGGIIQGAGSALQLYAGGIGK